MTTEARAQPETQQEERCRHMNEVIPTGACDVCHPEMFPPRAEVERQRRAIRLYRLRKEGQI